jgi:aspartate beta-hydroxylase
MSAIYERAGDAIRRIYDKRIHAPAVLDPSVHFPHAPIYIDRWQDLRREALELARGLDEVPRFHELMAAQADISANDGRDWQMHVCKAYGVRVPVNLQRCPILADLLTRTPEVLSACLSFVAPGKHIPRHRGPFRGILRFHLGLVVPLAPDGRPGTVLDVDGVAHRIGEGDSMLWDDTYPHELWNTTDNVRVALLLDVRRPGMPWDMEILSRLLTAAAGSAVWLQRARTPYRRKR